MRAGFVVDLFFFFFFFLNCIAHNYLLFTQVSLQYLFTQVTLQYLTNSLNINRNYGITQLFHTHSDTHTHEQIKIKKLHSKITLIWTWHVPSYSSTSIYIAHFFLNISKLLFFVQMYFSVTYFNLTFDLKPRILGSSLFLLHAHK